MIYTRAGQDVSKHRQQMALRGCADQKGHGFARPVNNMAATDVKHALPNGLEIS
jgi:hypothetical protein